MATNRYFDNAGLPVSDGTLAKATQVNNFISESNKAFELLESEVDVLASNVGTSRLWANEDQGVEIDGITYPGQYSARAWAKEAEAWAQGEGGVDLEADGVTPIPYSAKEKAEECSAHEVAAAASELAASISEGNADDSELAAGLSEDAALVSETNAGLSELAAGLSEDAALASEGEALAHENKAELWAQEAEDVEVEPGFYSAFHWAEKAALSAGTPILDNPFDATWDGVTDSGPSQNAMYDQLKKMANLESGASSFVGNGGEVTIPHGMGEAPSYAQAQVKADPAGNLGEVWVRQDATNIYVGNSGSYTGAFNWIAMLNL